MARLQGLKPDEARRFRTGRPCLDFAHTGGDGPYARFELLHTSEDLSRWLTVIVDLDDIEASDSDLEIGRELRRAIWNSAQHAAAGSSGPQRDRNAINRAAAWPPPVPMLDTSGKSAVQRPLAASQVLSMLARDAVDLFGGPLSERIRTCSAPDCSLLYVDRSRTVNRQWCSMQWCGTRTKVRAHRKRQARR
jgi:predicted RNA-binding Zn ribbon-like protein